jgi:hypothetical protein
MPEHTFSLTEFKKAQEEMISTSATFLANKWVSERVRPTREWTAERISNAIKGSSLAEMINLSTDFYNSNLIYQRLVQYYATLYSYSGVLIPSVKQGRKIEDKAVYKKYFPALDWIECVKPTSTFTECARRAIREGIYFGIIAEVSENRFSLIDLPPRYCRTRFKDTEGNHIVELNMMYFDQFEDPEDKKKALSCFPKIIMKAYNKYKANGDLQWFFIPSDIGVCFMFPEGRPPLIAAIAALFDYDEAVDVEKERQIEDIKKIIVQHVPHNQATNELVFEPDEAQVMHDGTVQMLKDNAAYSVLTSYADVTAIDSHTANDTNNTNLTTMLENIYNTVGTNSNIFGTGTYSSLKTSIQNDLTYMTPLVDQFSNFLTSMLNRLFSTANITFKYTFLPVSEYNKTDYIADSFKLASSGYSLLLPAIALGNSQRDLIDLKALENDLLKLNGILLPLSSSYTQTSSAAEAGGQEKAAADKAETTTAKDESQN